MAVAKIDKSLQEQADVLCTRISVLINTDNAFKDVVGKARKMAIDKTLDESLQEKAITFEMCLNKVKSFFKIFNKSNKFKGDFNALQEIETSFSILYILYFDLKT